MLWKMTPPEEWPHHFVHTLEGILANWYTDQELHRGTMSWTILQHKFIVTFSFEHENPNIDVALKKIRGVIFIKELEVELLTKETTTEQTDSERTTVMLPCAGRGTR